MGINSPSRQPTQQAWKGMMDRCYVTTNKDYPAVGGKGIVVCPQWHDYATFVADMGEKPARSMLRRQYAGLGFTPSNTYWLPLKGTTTNRLYGIWKGIKRRCGIMGRTPSANHSQYKLRGVEMFSDWAEDYDCFAAAVGEPPSDEHSIDRIDNNKGYFPGNVQWATSKMQGNNRTDNVYIEMLGQRKTLQEWADFYGINRHILWGRWGLLFRPTKNKRNSPCVQMDMEGNVLAEYVGVKVAAAATGLKQGTLSKCLSGGNDSAGGYRWAYKLL